MPTWRPCASGWTEQAFDAEFIAEDERILPAVTQLLEAGADSADPPRAVLFGRPNRLRAQLAPRLSRFGYLGFCLVSPEGIVLAADQDGPVGRTLTGYRKEFFEGVFAGKSAVSLPFPAAPLAARRRTAS